MSRLPQLILKWGLVGNQGLWVRGGADFLVEQRLGAGAQSVPVRCRLLSPHSWPKRPSPKERGLQCAYHAESEAFSEWVTDLGN